MNIIEKIIAHHAIGLSSPYVKPGEAVCVRVDWTMANELTLVGINDMYTKIGRPGVANKERVVRIASWNVVAAPIPAPLTLPNPRPTPQPPPLPLLPSGSRWTTPWTPATTTSPSPPR
jgi:hypothetical protein